MKLIKNLIARIPVTNYLIEVKDELSKVIWPTKKETVKMTLVVISVSFLVGLFVGGIDILLAKLTDVLIKK